MKVTSFTSFRHLLQHSRAALSFVLAACVLVLAAGVVACGGGDGGLAEARAATPSAALEIESRLSKFNKHGLASPPETDVTVTFVNRDVGVLHNVSFYTDKSLAEKIFFGELFGGAETREYHFRTPAPGEYFFRCDVHPDTMTGIFSVR